MVCWFCKSQRLKRRGGVTFAPLETAGAEERYGLEAAESDTPERAFDRRWAEAMLGVVLARLRAEFDDTRLPSRFDELNPYLLGEPDADGYAAVARRLHLSEQGVKSAVHRLRHRYRELLREEIAHTVTGPGEVEHELRHLFAVLAGG